MSENIAEYLKPFCRKMADKYDPEIILLFGSFARGDVREHSNINIALIFSEYKGDYMKAIADIWGDGKEFDVRIEAQLIERDNDPSGFAGRILKEGVILFKRE